MLEFRETSVNRHEVAKERRTFLREPGQERLCGHSGRRARNIGGSRRQQVSGNGIDNYEPIVNGWQLAALPLRCASVWLAFAESDTRCPLADGNEDDDLRTMVRCDEALIWRCEQARSGVRGMRGCVVDTVGGSGAD